MTFPPALHSSVLFCFGEYFGEVLGMEKGQAINHGSNGGVL